MAQNGSVKGIEENSVKGNMMKGLSSVKPLFKRPYLIRLVHACVNALMLLIG